MMCKGPEGTGGRRDRGEKPLKPDSAGAEEAQKQSRHIGQKAQRRITTEARQPKRPQSTKAQEF